MARAIWSGVLTFGLVTVPVQLFTATEDHTIHFHQLQRDTSDRVRYQRVNERTGKEVDYDDIVKGYDLGGGDYVIVEPDELDDIAQGKSQVIEITGFVDLEQVEPVYFDKTYYIAPKGEEYAKVYELLRAALEKENKTGIATFVMRGKQYLVALRAQEEVLVLHTLHWADEVRDPHQELSVLSGRGDAQGRELDTARQLIGALSIDWNPKDYHDTYEEKVKELVDAKAKGKEIVSEEAPPQATNVIDLMEALQRSVEQTRGSGSKAPEERRSKKSTAQKPARKPAGKSAGKPAKKMTAGKARPKETRASTTADSKGAGKRELRQLSKTELYQRASDQGIAGRSKMSHEELLDALARAGRRRKKIAA
ncbi:Ku protein [Streptomyces sp. Ru72]|uniref:non-homologous end joining protein Ku n=1 Tax=Streptomyces sp. Ru72 TaxID=2080747 RepID=UPI000CDD79FD|nr:Ku protein [Streptomyces sp. Ru72]POX40015.1 Ku protein [Streptomyces sp. Ru72]